MKKIISFILVAVIAFSALLLTGCGAINDSEVAILWSGEGVAKIPGSLIDSMERAMYNNSIAYKHYGANGRLDEQLQQAEDAIDSGCAAIAVELVSDGILELAGSQLVAKQIVDAAKNKNIPVIFFNSSVLDSIVNSYDKCVNITYDTDSIKTVQGKIIADYVKANFKAVDKNKDGKISYIAYNRSMLVSGAAIEVANALLASEEYKVKNAAGENINTEIVYYTSKLFDQEIGIDADTVINEKIELIFTVDDTVALEVLSALQKKDYNTDKLKTQFVPIFTVGSSADYKEYVLSGRPEIPSELLIKPEDDKATVKEKNSKIKKIAELQSYYEANKYLVDLTAVNESDLAVMIYNTTNVIDAGRISGTATVDTDAVSVAVASVIRNFIKGNEPFKGVASDSIAVDSENSYVKVSYKAYNN